MSGPITRRGGKRHAIQTAPRRLCNAAHEASGQEKTERTEGSERLRLYEMTLEVV
jgi:hypothetical protein